MAGAVGFWFCWACWLVGFAAGVWARALRKSPTGRLISRQRTASAIRCCSFMVVLLKTARLTEQQARAALAIWRRGDRFIWTTREIGRRVPCGKRNVTGDDFLRELRRLDPDFRCPTADYTGRTGAAKWFLTFDIAVQRKINNHNEFTIHDFSLHDHHGYNCECPDCSVPH
jgi:hypothetical protein